jgi:sugar lactone lactonase YvrE
VSPAQGPIAGGTAVTLNGANFSGTAITLDRIPITPISQSDSEVRLRMPKRDNGYAVIAVTSPAGAAYGEFLYLPPSLEELPPGYITTVAGVGHSFGDYWPATRAIVSPWGLAFDRAGNTYIAETANDRVVRVRADGILEPFAGNGRIDGPRPTGPASALEVPISFPRSVAVDGAGNVYIPDSNYYLWRVTPDGVAQIIAGTGRDSSSGDGGPAVMADIGFPNYVAVDATGNVYFISYDAARIRKIDRSGIISTIAGTGSPGFSGDGGPATQAQFKIPGPDQGGLAADDAGNLFLLDYSNQRIRRIDATTGLITTVVDPALARTALGDMKAVAMFQVIEFFDSPLTEPPGSLRELPVEPGSAETADRLQRQRSWRASNPMVLLSTRRGTSFFLTVTTGASARCATVPCWRLRTRRSRRRRKGRRFAPSSSMRPAGRRPACVWTSRLLRAAHHARCRAHSRPLMQTAWRTSTARRIAWPEVIP